MALEHPVYDPSVTSCTYFVRNGTEKTVEFGEVYMLQRWERGQWKNSPGDQRVIFIDIAYQLEPGGTKALTCWLGGEREPGSYRLVKEVGGETLYTQFQLGESHYTAANPYGFVPLEELDRIPDLQGPVSPEGGPGDLAEFVRKVVLDVPCQLRLIQGEGPVTELIYEGRHLQVRELETEPDAPGLPQPAQGEGAVTDVIYENRHLLLRKLEEGRITERRFSYLITDGQNLLLSNWADWAPGREAALLLPKAEAGLVEAVKAITADRLASNSARFCVWSEDGEWDAMLTDVPTEFGVGWQKPGEGSRGELFDLQHWDGMETAILDLSWQEDNTLLLTCQTAAGETCLRVFSPETKQLRTP